ncbi:MAG: hypothetical protein ACKO0Z_20835 [Betaproteobacteria bacterium]
MPSFKQFLSSRTNQFAIAVMVLTALQAFVVKLPFNEYAQAGIGLALGLAIMYLRWVTTQPLAEK